MPVASAAMADRTESPTPNPTFDPDRPARAIVAELDLATKIRLLSGEGYWWVEPLPEHGLPAVMVADGPHGLRRQGVSTDHLGIAPASPATCFPPAVTLGCTWDVDAVEAVGMALGDEAISQGVAVVLGPGLNIKRHPAGGRCFEYLSEDPWLSGTLAAAMVRGIQSRGVGASIKHFAVNNQESYRLVVDAIVDERTLREVYLTGFEIAVKESSPWTVMCSYNLVNGTYASEHTELLTTILRDEWGFDGLVISDWGAVNDRVAGIRAGLDLEMPSSQGAYDAAVVDAVASGALDEDAVDRCVTRVVELLQRARRAEPPSTASAVDPVDPVDERHHEVARTAAAAGTVLLRNTGVLPIDPSRRIAVVGAFADEPRYQGAGSSQVNPTRVDRALEVLRERTPGGHVTYAPGFVARDGSTTSELLAEALRVADGAEVVVVFAGLPAADESEGFDRTSLDLPEGQTRLIEALAATGTPIVVVLNNGGAVHLPWADRVDAVLECWLGGQAGGRAAVDVLLGVAEPGGRLAQSLPEHVAQLPADRNFPGEPRQVQHREAHHIGYRFHDRSGVPAHFAFGHGLSYTSFDWAGATIEGAGTDVVVRVRVTNTGERSGSDVVQVYVRDVESTLDRPDQELKGYAKVHLAPGEHEDVTIRLDRRSFAVWDVAAHDWLVEAGAYEVVVARSSVDAVATLVHEVASDDVVAPAAGPSRFVATDDEFAAMLRRPVPAVRPARPFTRMSTLADLEATRVGALLVALVIRVGIRESAKEFPDPDEATVTMVTRALREGPARLLVQMGGGAVTFATLDLVLDALNGHWPAVASGIRGAAGQVVRRTTGRSTEAGTRSGAARP